MNTCAPPAVATHASDCSVADEGLDTNIRPAGSQEQEQTENFLHP